MWLRHALLSGLEGRWSLDRTIEELGSGKPLAAMAGDAVFTPEGEGEAAYAETALLSLESGPAMPATRRYFYRQEADGVSIFFDAERVRLFHRLRLEEDGGRLGGADLHLCAPDRYESRYDYRADGSFAVVHVVTGPRKAYTSRTLYRRTP